MATIQSAPKLVAATKGLTILFSARIEIRAQNFMSMVDEKSTKNDLKKFLVFVIDTQAVGYFDADVNKVNDDIFKELYKTELAIDDVRAGVAARQGA